MCFAVTRCIASHSTAADRRSRANFFWRLLTVVHKSVMFHAYRYVIDRQSQQRGSFKLGLGTPYMRRLAVTAALLALGTSGAARASEIVLFDGTVTADIGATAPLGIDPTLGDANGGFGGGLLSGDIGFLARDGKITITVTDLGTTASGRAGSAYQVLLDTNSLGVTSATDIGGATFSTGTFSSTVTAGFHDLGVWDFISTFTGLALPNGESVDADFAQANVSVLVTEAPEPATWMLIGMGLVSLAMIAQRRKRAQTAI